MRSSESPITSVLTSEIRSTLTSTKTLATLWSNYGHVYRLSLSSDPHQLILKSIAPPPLTASTSASESHIRKLISYRVERFFYTHLSSLLPKDSKVARCYPIQPAFQHEALLLEDLNPEYPHNTSGFSFNQASVVLKWLAGFHAAFWMVDTTGLEHAVDPPLKVGKPDETEGVWRQGGYWYLDTRREDLEGMIASGEYTWLEPWVEKVQDMLRREDMPGRTLVHGDLKAANIVFSRDWKRCAAYDFQYVGKGLGVQDLVYFLGTSVARQVMTNEAMTERLLDGYHEELRARLGERMGGYTKGVMGKQLEIAIVDWFRFMAGWGFWGNGWVNEETVREIVERLERGETGF